jgi:hypothetical protein
MASDRPGPDPRDFLELAQRMLRDLFTDQRSDDSDEPWAEATRGPRESFTRERDRGREPSPQKQRENLTFALATRAVEALEDLALNVAAIRQRLERRDAQAVGEPGAPEAGGPAAGGPSASGEEPPPSAPA